jgi:hypothetical protein
MIGWPIRSALLIDYENVAHKILPDTIPDWMAWLERGEFDANGRRKRRRFVTKRIYWNSAAHHLRGTFERFGFSCVLCEKLAGMKNGADIKMAMDIVEFARDMPSIKEFILLTRDSDFVPVLKMLRQRRRRTAVLVDPRSPRVFSTYRTHADAVIPIQDLLAATSYRKPARSELFRQATRWVGQTAGRAARWPLEKTRRITRSIADRRAAAQAAAEKAALAAKEAAEAAERMELAVDYTIRVTSLQPNQGTANRTILRELAKIPGFSTSGARSYLGRASYRALMEEIARRTDKLRLAFPSGGVSVMYVPKDEEKGELRVKRVRRRRIRRKKGQAGNPGVDAARPPPAPSRKPEEGR